MARTPTTQTLTKLIAFAKGLDATTLKDIEDIEAVQDGHGRAGLPPDGAIPTGPAQEMRGGQAQTQVEAHSEIKPGDRATQDYAEVSRRMSAMEKSVGSIAPVVAGLAKALKDIAKADEDEKAAAEAAEAETDKDVEKALRKARISIVKAEDKDEDEDAVEKADAAVAAAAAAVSKAEDDAEDDKAEDAAAKARVALKALRTRLVAAKALRTPVAAPAAAVTPVAAPAPAQKAEEDAMSLIALKSGISIAELMQRLSGASQIVQPPEFAKSLAAAGPADIAARAEQMNDEGVLSDIELGKCQSLVGRLRAVQAGQYDLARFSAEVSGSSDNVKRLFGA